MLTLAFAQISWSIVFQWDSFTGGSNGLFGIWPSAWLAGKTDLLLPGARPLRRRHRAAVARAVLALRLRPARRPRFAVARRSHRHRRARLPVDGLRAGGRRGGSGRRGLCLLQGQHLALGHLDRPVDRRAGHGAAGRRRDPHRSGRGGGDLHLAARRGRPPHRILAGRDRRGDPADRAALSAGPRRRPQGARDASLAQRRAHDRGACRSKACTRRSAACRPWPTSPSPSTPASFWR